MAVPTSFETMNKEELVALAGNFGTDLDMQMTKTAMLQTLKDDGVTFGMYKQSLTPDPDEALELAAFDDTPLREEEPEPDEVVDEEDTYVLRMTRKNKTYQIRGYQFTQDHPYALVKEEDADFLIDQGGFRMAGPREITEYYAKG